MGPRNLSLFRVMVTIYERLRVVYCIACALGYAFLLESLEKDTHNEEDLALERHNSFDMLMGFGPSTQIYIRIKY
jgi:hypothetical protein